MLQRLRITGVWVLVALAAWLACTGRAEADAPIDARSAEERFLDGLRARRLFTLADAYCQERLAEADLTAAERAMFTVERSRTFAEQALQSSVAQREALWRQAFEVAEQWLENSPNDPRRALVEVQAGLVRLAHGALLGEEAELNDGDAAGFEAARNELRAAIRTLSSTEETIAQRLRGAAIAPPEAEGLSPAEWESLGRHVRYQLARAYRNQAGAYPPESNDRVLALGRAVELLGPLAQSEATDPLAWPSRLDEITCFRLLADHETAARRLAAAESREPPPGVADDLRAEAIRLALASGKLDRGLALADMEPAPGERFSPRLDLARLEAFLAAWRKASTTNNQAEAARRRERATAQRGLIATAHPPYWGRRADMLLSEASGSGTLAGGLDVLVGAADRHYRAGRVDQALAAYDDARAQAIRTGDGEAAFELAYKAAAIEHERRRFPLAAARFRDLALSAPAHPRAGEAHLLAIYDTTQAASAASQDADAASRPLLEEHLHHWPTGASADQARWWHGQIHQRGGRWKDAVSAYRFIAPEHERYLEAIAAAAACYEAWLAEERRAGRPLAEPAREAAGYFEQIVAGSTGRLPERWTDAHRAALLAAASVRLKYTPDGFRRAEQLLAAGLSAPNDGASEAYADWRSAAQALLVFALAAQPERGREAAAALEQLAQGSPRQLLELVDNLEAIAGSAAPAARRELADLQLRAAALAQARRDELAPADRVRFNRLYARALAASGRRDAALAAYEALTEAFPRDGALHEAHAELLAEGETKSEWEGALAKWREIERRSRPDDPRWFRAKYYVALLHERLGDPERAAKIITVTQVLHPELGGPEWKPKFLELLARCENAAGAP